VVWTARVRISAFQCWKVWPEVAGRSFARYINPRPARTKCSITFTSWPRGTAFTKVLVRAPFLICKQYAWIAHNTTIRQISVSLFSLFLYFSSVKAVVHTHSSLPSVTHFSFNQSTRAAPMIRQIVERKLLVHSSYHATTIANILYCFWNCGT